MAYSQLYLVWYAVCAKLLHSGHEIAPNTVANATKITALATKIQKLVAKLATRTLQVLSILPWCILQLNKSLGRSIGANNEVCWTKSSRNATKRTCQHPPSWIFQTSHCILWNEMSLLLTTHIAGSQHSVLFRPWRHLPHAFIWLYLWSDWNLKWEAT